MYKVNIFLKIFIEEKKGYFFTFFYELDVNFM